MASNYPATQDKLDESMQPVVSSDEASIMYAMSVISSFSLNENARTVAEERLSQILATLRLTPEHFRDAQVAIRNALYAMDSAIAPSTLERPRSN